MSQEQQTIRRRCEFCEGGRLRPVAGVWHCDRCLLDYVPCSRETCDELTVTAGRFCRRCGAPLPAAGDALSNGLARLRRLKHFQLTHPRRRVLGVERLARYPMCVLKEDDGAGTCFIMIPPYGDALQPQVVLPDVAVEFDVTVLNRYEVLATAADRVLIVNVVYEDRREIAPCRPGERIVQQAAFADNALLVLTAVEDRLARAVVVPCGGPMVRPRVDQRFGLDLGGREFAGVFSPLYAGRGRWIVFFTAPDGALMVTLIDAAARQANTSVVLSATSGALTCTRGHRIAGAPWIARVEDPWLHVGLVAYVTSVLDRGWKQIDVNVNTEKAIVRKLQDVAANNITRVDATPGAELVIAGDMRGGESIKDFARLGRGQLLTLYTRNNIDYVAVGGREFKLPGSGEWVDVWGRYIILTSYEGRERKMLSIFGEEDRDA